MSKSKTKFELSSRPSIERIQAKVEKDLLKNVNQ